MILILTAILWSIGGIFIKWIDWSAPAIAGMRSLLAAATLLLLRPKGPFRLSKSTIAGACAYCGTVVLLVIATKLTTAANAILLQYTAPIYVALLSHWFLHERISRLDWVTIAVVVGGLTLFFIEKVSFTAQSGNLIALISGICFAWLVLLLRKQKESQPVDIPIAGNILSAAVCLPWMLQSMPSAKGWVGLLILGVVQLGLSYRLYTAAIRHVKALDAIVVPILEPLLNPVWVFIFIGEKPGLLSCIGGGIVLCAITVRGMRIAFRSRIEVN